MTGFEHLKKLDFVLENERSTINLGHTLSNAIGYSGLCIYLVGDLGAGKTTFSRGIIKGYGHQGAVKSPTYTIVEPYELTFKDKPRFVYHFDFYRLSHPTEVEFLGLEDYFSGSSLCLIEWPDKVEGCIPPPDIKINLYEDFDIKNNLDSDDFLNKRFISFEAFSGHGNEILSTTKKLLQSDSNIKPLD